MLSYPSVDGDGQPLYPSPYLTALQSLFEPDAVRVETAGQLDPAPPVEVQTQVSSVPAWRLTTSMRSATMKAE